MYMLFSWPWPMNLLFAHSSEESCGENDCLWPYRPSWCFISFVVFIFVSFTFFISSDINLTALRVSLILPKLLFLIYSWDTDFQFLPDQSIIPAFASDKPSFEADALHCFSSAAPQALWTFTDCPPSNSPLLWCQSWQFLGCRHCACYPGLLPSCLSGPNHSVLSFTASPLELFCVFLHLCKTLQ